MHFTGRRIAAWLIASILLMWGCPTAPYGEDDDDQSSQDDDDTGDDDTGDDDTGDDDTGDDDTGDDDTGDDDTGDDDTGDDDTGDDDTADVEPPLHGSSGGSGGTTCPNGCVDQVGAVEYRIIVPGSYSGASTPMLLVFSGTEGGAMMTQNLLQVAPHFGLGSAIIAVIDGWEYFDDGGAGVVVLDDVRSLYNIDNDRTYLLSESAGTRAGLELGFELRQTHFAAFWANDVNAAGAPVQTAGQLGFAPWGNAGPGGDYTSANAIVDAMDAAGYRFDGAAPYDGAGAGQHGSPDQFFAAVSFFSGKSRL